MRQRRKIMGNWKSLSIALLTIAGTFFVAGNVQANYTWNDGARFVGTNNASGGGCLRGTLYYASGNKFYGTFYSGSCRKLSGTFTWSSGSTYRGTWTYGGDKKRGLTRWTSGNTFNGTYYSNGNKLNGTFSWADGTKYTGTYDTSGNKKRGTLTWKRGDKFTGTYYSNGKIRTGRYTWVNGDSSSYTNGVENVGWRDGAEPHDWSNIKVNSIYTTLAMEYAERIYPGITKMVDFRVGKYDSSVCSCGGYTQMAVFNGKQRFRIAVYEGWFRHSYDTHWGYVPDAYQALAHEIAHVLNYIENGWDSDSHGPRFKHWYQEVIPPHLAWIEEGYDYPKWRA